MTENVIRVITTQTKVVATNEIESATIADGMLTMVQDGVLKAIAGQTTLEEVFRVLD